MEPQCEAGIHASQQAGQQERANPQTWRQSEAADTQKQQGFYSAQAIKSNQIKEVDVIPVLVSPPREEV